MRIYYEMEEMDDCSIQIKSGRAARSYWLNENKKEKGYKLKRFKEI